MLEAEKTTPFSHLQTWDDIKAAKSQGEFPDPTGDIRKAECVFRVWEIEGPDLARFPLDLSHFEKTIPRFDKRNSTLSGRIAKAGISPSTYKQCRASARRVIVHATSEVDNAIINNGPDDEWEKLQASLKALAGVGLVTRPQIASLSNLILHAQTPTAVSWPSRLHHGVAPPLGAPSPLSPGALR